MEFKVIDADDNTFINSLVADSHQEIYYRGWVDVTGDEKKPKPRILVVTNFRIYSIKTGMLGRSVRQQFPIRDLLVMTSFTDIAGKTKLQLEFAGLGEVVIEAASQQDIIQITQAILFSFRAISYGRPTAEQPRIELPPFLLKDFLAPEPDSQDGLLACYLAECDYVAIPQRIHVLDHLMTCFQLQDRTLDLDECLSFLDKETPTKDLQALASALRNSEWFTELVALGGIAWKSEGLAALAPVFSAPTKITKAVLVNVKAGKTGFVALAKALAAGKHSLTFLNVSKNKLADDGVEELCKGIDAGKRALHTLALRDCGVSSKGFKSLQTLLSTPLWLSGLRVLDVSENRAGKAGSQALAAWLSCPDISLEQFHASSCDVDLEVVLKAITGNRRLLEETLRTLNISGNKISGKGSVVALIGSLLINTRCITQILFSECGLTYKNVVSILEDAHRNSQGVKFNLDFSNNDLGSKVGKSLQELCEKWNKEAAAKPNLKCGVIHSLNLSKNNLGTDGLVAVCKALTGTAIHTLALDANLKVSVWTSGKEVGDALAAFINATPSLKELSVAGDDAGKFYLKTALNALFTGLKTNKTLTSLDVSRNRFGEKGMKALAEALVQNDSLASLSLDGNKLTMKAVRELHKAVTRNRSLHDWQIPMDDIAKVFKGLKNEKKMHELRIIVAEFENVMDRNEEAAQSRREAEEKKNAKGVAPAKAASPPAAGFSAMRGMRMSLAAQGSYGGSSARPHHRKTASRMMDNMVLLKRAGGLLPDDDDDGLGDRPGTVDEDDEDDDDGEGDDDDDDDDDEEEGGKKKKAGAPKKEEKKAASGAAAPSTPKPVSAAGVPPASPARTPAPAAVSAAGAPSASPRPSVIGKAFADWKTVSFPIDQLVMSANLPDNVDPGNRELYLSDEDFKAKFSMDKEAWLKVPMWKRTSEKKKHNLF